MLLSNRTLGVSSLEHFGRLERALAATGVVGVEAYRQDSRIEWRGEEEGEGSGFYSLEGGLAKDVWDAVEVYTGIAVRVTRGADMWDSSEVSSVFYSRKIFSVLAHSTVT